MAHERPTSADRCPRSWLCPYPYRPLVVTYCGERAQWTEDANGIRTCLRCRQRWRVGGKETHDGIQANLL